MHVYIRTYASAVMGGGINFAQKIMTSLDFNFVKPCLVMWQFDSTIGLMD